MFKWRCYLTSSDDICRLIPYVFVILFNIYAFWVVVAYNRHSGVEVVLPELWDPQDICHGYQINCRGHCRLWWHHQGPLRNISQSAIIRQRQALWYRIHRYQWYSERSCGSAELTERAILPYIHHAGRNHRTVLPNESDTNRITLWYLL